MRERTAILIVILVCITTLVVVVLHDGAHRYDVIAVGVGGSNGQTGSIEAYLTDHKTGQVWVRVGSFDFVPMHRMSLEETYGRNQGK